MYSDRDITNKDEYDHESDADKGHTRIGTPPGPGAQPVPPAEDPLSDTGEGTHI